MPDYSKTQIYRFICNDLSIKDNYIGSTTNWTKRKQHHKISCNNLNDNKSHLTIYKIMRENGGFENWNMILIEDYPCENKRQAEQREQYWKEFYNDNMGHRAFTTKENRLLQLKTNYETKKEPILEKARAYYQANKDLILSKQKEYRKLKKLGEI
jgi:hypothetical protein